MRASRESSVPVYAPLPATSRRRRRRPLINLNVLLDLGPLPFAVAVVLAVAWYQVVFAGFAASGMVRDSETGQPVESVQVWSSSRSVLSAADGTFSLPGVKPPESVGFIAPGYVSASLRPLAWSGDTEVRLQPVALEVVLQDADSGEPVDGASLLLGGETVATSAAGRLRIAPVRPTDHWTVRAAGYAPYEMAFPGAQREVTVALTPTYTGQVTDRATGRPIPGARVVADGLLIAVDEAGAYQLPARPSEERLLVLAPGYRRGAIDLRSQRSLDVALDPLEVKGLYLTFFAIGSPTFQQRMFELLDTTELNSVVIDIKGDRGLLAYRSDVPLAEQIGANASPTIEDLGGLLHSLRERNVYTIARIVVFKDDLLARNDGRAGVDVAIKDGRTGAPWIDGEGLAWVDPFQTAAWDYNVALAREAIQRGFDEVQFDYIRFPTDPSSGNSLENAQYSKLPNATNRVQALRSFLTSARAAVNEEGGLLGIDTFGYSAWWEGDGGIGQDLTVLGDAVDYVCPMLYPSTYSAGLPGMMPYPSVVQNPYEVVYLSLESAKLKVAGKRTVLRPWIQYFDDYEWATKARYDAPHVEAQKQAVVDAGAGGWMLWDPFNVYERGGLAPRAPAMAPSP